MGRELGGLDVRGGRLTLVESSNGGLRLVAEETFDRVKPPVGFPLNRERYDELKRWVAHTRGLLSAPVDLSPASVEDTEIGRVNDGQTYVKFVEQRRDAGRFVAMILVAESEYSSRILHRYLELDAPNFADFEKLLTEHSDKVSRRDKGDDPAPEHGRDARAETVASGRAATPRPLAEALRLRVIGQDDAIEAVVRVVNIANAGFVRENRPRGVLLFVGPTGVGKTELAKALADVQFGSRDDLLILDMSGYKEAHSVSRLFGSPDGYMGHERGGQLTNWVSKRRGRESIVLLDEIEKAHPDVIDVFLPVFDEARLTDTRGQRADFTKTIIT